MLSVQAEGPADKRLHQWKDGIVTTSIASNSINITPGVSILSVLRHLNYKTWFALAEFVDNSIESFITNRDELARIDGENVHLTVSISIDADADRITIADNAAGIREKDYARAFRPAAIPPNRDGLSEFGMGMKSAACWFADVWTVRTCAIGEPLERVVTFDINKIVHDNLEELVIQTRPIAPDKHYTEIVLTKLNQLPQTRTTSKIKDHLTSIYRVYLRDGLLELRFNGDQLRYTDPPVLVAPFYKTETDEAFEWKKDIDLDFGLGFRVWGFAALREKASTTDAGFALFRRNRLIEGSQGEGYRPPKIFGQSNDFVYQRLFGELHLEGFEVSHTKDGFRWKEYEDEFLDLLKEELNKEPLALLSQARNYRVRGRRPKSVEATPKPLNSLTNISANKEVHPTAPSAGNGASSQAPNTPSDHNSDPLQHKQGSGNAQLTLPESEAAVADRVIRLSVDGYEWTLNVELATDPAVGDLITVHHFDYTTRQVGIRIAVAHAVFENFGCTSSSCLESVIRICSGLVLGELLARASGVRQANVIRRNLNDLLRDALSRPELS